MKIMPLKENYINAQKSHILFLNHQCNALVHYADQFHPGWKVLNENPVYYTYDELISKGIIMEAQEPETKQSALVIFAPKLKYGEGIINNFPFNNVYIYLGDMRNIFNEDGSCVSPWVIENDKLQIPPTALPNVDYEITKADLVIKSENTSVYEDVVFYYDVETSNVNNNLTFRQGANNIILSPSSMSLESYFPRNRIIMFSDEKEVEDPLDGKLLLLPTSTYLISQYANEVGRDSNGQHLAISDARDKGNYIIARLARGGGYYSFQYGYDPTINNGEGGLFAFVEYIPEATDVMGLKYIIDSDPRQKRFTAPLAYRLYNKKSSVEQPAFITNESNESVFQITTLQGGVWSGNNLINHEFSLHYTDDNETKIRESFIIDDTRIKKSKPIGKIATPVYRTDFNNNLKLIPIYIIW